MKTFYPTIVFSTVLLVAIDFYATFDITVLVEIIEYPEKVQTIQMLELNLVNLNIWKRGGGIN